MRTVLTASVRPEQPGRLPRSRMQPPRGPSLRRVRLERRLANLADHGICVVVAPAGSGKTTLLAQIAGSWCGPVVWYRAEVDDAPAERMVAALATATAAAFCDEALDAQSIDDLVDYFDGRPGEHVLIVIDDLHAVTGGSAEGTIERLGCRIPSWVTLMAGSRCVPNFDLSRLRVSGELLEVGPDDLRFRSWEVEELFRSFYGELLSPEEVAELTRRTEGWPAGLQLYHLAIQGRSVAERRRLLRSLGSRSRGVSDYLTRNVLGALPDDLQSFLLRTSVLGHLSGSLCDELLGATDSERVLQELERKQVFTMAVDEERSAYRYHEVLRCHLESALPEELGDAQTQSFYRRAGDILHAAGILPHALRAYCRAQDWDAAAALVGRRGEHLAAEHGAWLDTVFPAFLSQDPWLLVASARRRAAEGGLQAALHAYNRAESIFVAVSAAQSCTRERVALAAWLEPMPSGSEDWLGLLRTSLQRDPLKVAGQATALPGWRAPFVEGVATLLAGRFADGARLLAAVAETSEANPVVATVARALVAASDAVSQHVDPERFGRVADQAEAVGVPWLARVCHGLLRCVEGPPPAEIPMARAEGWDESLDVLLRGIGLCRCGKGGAQSLRQAVDGFRMLGAGVAEAWAMAALAIAAAIEGDRAATEVAASAEALARSLGVRGAEGLAVLALASSTDDAGGRHHSRAEAIAYECGLSDVFPALSRSFLQAARRARPTQRSHPNSSGATADDPVLRIQCLGEFRLLIKGAEIDCRRLKPRVRAALHLLALQVGRPLHRERLVEALWPHLEPAAGLRNLHVAVSSLRQLLEPDSRRSGSIIARSGESYRLELPDQSEVDLLTFADSLTAAKLARATDDVEAAVGHFNRALAVYRGELLPEDGPVEWVVKERERYRMEAGDAAQTLAELHQARGDTAAAITACEQALQVDRYRDSAWRLLVALHRKVGDQAAARRAAAAYEEVLRDLGVDVHDGAR